MINTRYVNVLSPGEDFRLCANKEGVLEYAVSRDIFDSFELSDKCYTEDNDLVKITKLGVKAFRQFHVKQLKFSLNSQIEVIMQSCFEINYRLTSVVLPASLKIIEKEAFSCCTNLAEVSFAPGSHLEIIGKRSFKACCFISFLVPASTSQILNQAFAFCCQLKDFKFEAQSKISIIKQDAFVQTNIEKLELPNHVPDMHEFFPYSLKILSISNSSLCVNENMDLYQIHPFSLKFGAKNRKTFFLREGIISLCNKSLMCSEISKIHIPSTVKYIDNNAFYSCSNLKRISFSKHSNLLEIGCGTFSYCRSLKSIVFPESLEIICSNAFSFCQSMRIVQFPINSLLKKCDENAFNFCKGLTKIIYPIPIKAAIDPVFFISPWINREEMK